MGDPSSRRGRAQATRADPQTYLLWPPKGGAESYPVGDRVENCKRPATPTNPVSVGEMGAGIAEEGNATAHVSFAELECADRRALRTFRV